MTMDHELLHVNCKITIVGSYKFTKIMKEYNHQYMHVKHNHYMSLKQAYCSKATVQTYFMRKICLMIE